MKARSDAVAVLWQAMIERAETLNDTVVAGQRRADPRIAGRIVVLAHEIATLATAAQVLRARAGTRR